ncbi:MAG TPA: radical SAM protein [Anaeromyxobacteraceae bacterium]|jgi:MoaA/NifB/PqqE/SkfB family radical SAM enzyme|nr:radical SAM protein [Anaeromyxobacteraceae bacterium]
MARGAAETAAGPWRLTFVTNPDDCNLACDMCPGHSRLGPGPRRPPRRLDPGLVLAVVAERAGSPLREVIPSTMGEPLLWPGLDRLAAACGERGLALNVTTNGTFPGLGARGWARLLAPVARDVKVSWNGASAAVAERLMAGLRYEEAVANLRAFLDERDAIAAAGGNRCRVSFQVTAQEENLAELPEVVRLAARLGVERVKLNHLQPRLPGLAGPALGRDAGAAARWNEAVRACRRAAAEAPLPAGGRVALENAVELPVDGAVAPLGPCPFLGREGWVLADGAFAPCPHPAAAEGQLGTFGNLAARTVAEIWAGAELAALRRDHQAHPVCRSCSFRRPGGAG